MTKDDLFAYARNTDPGTSHAAARSLDKDAVSHLERLALNAIKSRNGTISDELVEITGIPWKTITPRLAPLARKGLITSKIDPNTGKELTRKAASGRQQKVWFVK